MYCGVFWHTDVTKLVILDEMGMPFPLQFDVSLIPTAARAVDLADTNSAVSLLQSAVGTLNTGLATASTNASNALSAANSATATAANAQAAATAAGQAVAALAAPMKWEVITVTLGAGGTANATFAKTYTEVPLVLPMTRFVGDQMFAAVAGAASLTGVTVTGKRSRGTLLLTSGPFEPAASGDVVQLAVLGR
ncbi:hypothetical protein [Pseudomonas sichuanensis]|uniref:hypothetical protein n=1 Tax=Pseudomonas sichuanensis TaxID=2213015 RepID=UPI000DA67F7D|nr:hypothetical protein [Pseudomonas sichuanensis]